MQAVNIGRAVSRERLEPTLQSLREYIQGGTEPANLATVTERICRRYVAEISATANRGDDPFGGVGGDEASFAAVASCLFDRLIEDLRAVGRVR